MSINESFFDEIYAKAESKDRAFLANMRLADHPKLGYRVYSVLARHGINLEPYSCRPYMVLGASVARTGRTCDGTLSLGAALRKAFEDRGADDPNLQIRLRRLVSCESSLELCKVLPAVLRLIESRLNEGEALCCKDTFKLIKLFDIDRRRSRAMLIRGFYGQDANAEAANDE